MTREAPQNGPMEGSGAAPHVERPPSPSPPRADDIIKPLDDEQLEFDFWQDLKDSLPPWLDEVVGFALVVFGILSFIALFFPTEALVAAAWSDILNQLFGSGSVIVAGAVFAIGVLLWLPATGWKIGFRSAQFLALEIAFLCSLALLHLSHSDVELRALARAGQGGGLIGWGISYPFYWIMGRHAAFLFFALLCIGALIVVIGLRRRHIAQSIDALTQRLSNYGEAAANNRNADEDALGLFRQLASEPGYRSRIMRIRPDPSNVPEHVRLRNQSGEKPKVKPVVAQLDATPPVAEKQNAELAPEEDAQPQGAPREFGLPDTDLLTPIALRMPSPEEVRRNVSLIKNTLLEFDIDITINDDDVQVGPTVTRYALKPHNAAGDARTRLSKIASYSRDLSLALAAKRLRMETPVPGTNYMGIEVPNKSPATVALRNVLDSQTYRSTAEADDAALPIPLGRDVRGEPVAIDLADLPHLLIAGATGSGKSVCMAAIVTALLMQNTPDQLQLIMLDPKMVELTRFNGIPHLLGPVETDHARIVGVLRFCAREMDRRYKLLEKAAARNIERYNQRQDEIGNHADKLQRLVIMIDEIGDLMLANPAETEAAITRLAQMARAVGMHLVVATQRPSVDVLTGLIKANFPSRIAFSVASAADSRVILDKTGAENLLGKGDMLLLTADKAAPIRVQGCFVSEDDARAVFNHWRQWQAAHFAGDADPGPRRAPWDRALKRGKFLSDTDPMLEDVVALVVDAGEASASLIQRRLGLGYPRAARIMDLLEELGVVGEAKDGGRTRQVIIPPVPDPFRFVLERHLNQRDKDQPDA